MGLDGHDRFLAALESEVDRARFFGRSLSVAMFAANDKSSVHDWVEHVASAKRPVDRLALYSGTALELLLPEATGEQATALIEGMLDGRASLACSLSTYPDCGTTAEMLLESCRTALHDTSSDDRFALAPSIVVSERRGNGADAPAGIIATSPSMQEVLDMARRVARGTIPVFVHGETGTGKEVLARFIHEAGPRKDGPLVAVNCAAIPSQLVESTLFGHVKGAFTGANQAHAGVFEAGRGGTVLLDEIGELPAEAQAALLRVLETKTLMRVGSTKEIPIDARIIAATHRNLEVMCESGEFREDLFYRLNAITLDIPPLRERREDIAPLADHFLAQAAEANDRTIHHIAPDARRAMRAYDWSGNIRELRNAIARAVVIAEQDVVTLRDLPRKIRDVVGAGSDDDEHSSRPSPPAGALRREGESFREAMERLETSLLVEALTESDGNQTEAARRMDMPRRTLVHKIKVYGIKREDYESQGD
jgi:DNA-binding NtrC family response regulator